MRPRKDSKDVILGGKQLMILQLVFSLKENAYGGEMYRVLADNGNRTFLPQIYKALDALERKGFVEHEFVEAEGDKRGGKRKVYRLTASGSRVLSMSLVENPQLGRRSGWAIPGLTNAK